MTSPVLRGCIGVCAALVIVGCDRRTPEVDKTKAPALAAPTPSPSSQSATAASEPDDKAIATSFTEFAPKFAQAMQVMNHGQTWTVKSSDVERTTSVLNPLRGKLTCEFVTEGKSWEYESRWRFKAEFNRVEKAWMIESSTTEILIKGRTYSDELLREMDHTLSIQAKNACRDLAK